MYGVTFWVGNLPARHKSGFATEQEANQWVKANTTAFTWYVWKLVDGKPITV